MAELGMFEPMAKMAEGILIGHKIDAEFAATSVEFADIVASDRAPIAPDWFIMRVGEGVLGVDLKFVDLELGEMIDEVEKSRELRHAATRDVEHDSAARKISVIADF